MAEECEMKLHMHDCKKDDIELCFDLTNNQVETTTRIVLAPRETRTFETDTELSLQEGIGFAFFADASAGFFAEVQNYVGPLDKVPLKLTLINSGDEELAIEPGSVIAGILKYRPLWSYHVLVENRKTGRPSYILA